MPVEKKIKKSKDTKKTPATKKKTTGAATKVAKKTSVKKVGTKKASTSKAATAKAKKTTATKKKKAATVKKIIQKEEKIEKVPVRTRIAVKIENTPKPGPEERKFKEDTVDMTSKVRHVRKIDEADLEKSLHGINFDEFRPSKKHHSITAHVEHKDHHEEHGAHENHEAHHGHHSHHEDHEDHEEELSAETSEEEEEEWDEEEYYDEEEDEYDHAEEKKSEEIYSPGVGFVRSEMAPSFNKLHEEVNRKNKNYNNSEEAHDELHDRSISLYRKIAFSFVGLTVILLAVVLYFSLVKVNITIIPVQERISNNMIFDVRDEDAVETDNLSKKNIQGIVRNISIESKKEYLATGKEIVGQEAVGKVKIFNNYSKNQPLVASTRLITTDSKLFRIKNTVNIPAGGSAEVEIYADKPSPSMEVGPTKFTIPGLWAGLQDKIYAESYEPVVYGEKIKRHVSSEDIDGSIAETKERLLNDVKTELDSNYGDYSQIIFDLDENSIKTDIDAAAGDDVEKFTINMTADVILVAFNNEDIVKVAKQKFISSLTEDKELLTFDENNIIYSLNSYDSIEGIATINSTFEGRISLKENSEIVEIDKIIGLNDKQLETYLSGIPEIAGYEVDFYPSFVKTVPKLVDRIKIDIKK